MRRSLLGILLAAISAAMLPLMAAAYYVVLTDGTWAPAAGKPTVAEGKAMIPLRGGMIAVIDEKLIDWTASKKYSAAGEQPPGPHAVPGEGLAANVVFTNSASAGGDGGEGGLPASPSSPAAPAAPSAPAATPPAPAASNASRIASLKNRIATLDEGIATLNNQAGELQQRMDGQWSLDEKATMEQQMEKIQSQISQLRSEKEDLLTDLWDLQQP